MTAKKKPMSANPLGHDTGHGEAVQSGLVNPYLTGMTLTEGSNKKSALLAPTQTVGVVSKVYQHWAYGDAASGSSAEWNNNILSDNKSDYKEGEVIPHVFVYSASNKTPLVQGQSYSFNITYDHYQVNTNSGGFVGLTSVQDSRVPSSWPTGNTPSTDGTFSNGGGTAGAFMSINADITNVSAVTYASSNTKQGHVTVTFVYTGPTTTKGGAEIYYGLQIAKDGDVPDQGAGPTNGASSWTGGSLQTTVDIGGSGATSLQLSPKAIIPLIPGLAIDKAVDGVYQADGVTLDSDGIADQAGDIVKYSVVVTNTGNQDLTGVSVVDPLTGQNVSGVTLLVGGSATYTSSYTVTQADLDNRGGGDNDIDNTATADSDQTAPTSDSATAPLAYTPAITVDKVFDKVTGGNGNGIADAAGDVLNYAVVVSNTGNITLTGITVVDPLTGQNLSGITLAVGETQTFTSSYTLTQADLDTKGGGDGDVDNTATVDSNETDPSSDSETVPLAYLPVLAIAKSYDSVTGGNQNDKIDLPGEVLHYTVTITNNGNVTLTGVTVTDPLTGQNVTGVTLAPGASQSYGSTYTLTQADLDNNGGGDGDIDNTATTDSNETDPVSASATAPLDFIPALKITKTFLEVTDGNGNTIADAAGDIIHYRVTVTNIDGQSLTNVTIVDPLTGQNLSGITLAAGESQSFDSSYVLKQSDLDDKGGGDGDLDNTATADSDQTDPVSASAEVPLVYAPDMSVDKVFDGVTGGNGNGAADAAGDVLNYRVFVTNTGNITLTGVTVVDPLTGQNLSGITIAPGTSQWFASTYTLTQADLDTNGGGDGHIENTATADSNETDPHDDSERVDLTVRPKQGARRCEWRQRQSARRFRR
ncbi:MAG: DUF11 domain-containing protein [Betaproteobacteria bacterium]|nr:DUF11 domain-containing protein [Betaproteobacteria bacterium]